MPCSHHGSRHKCRQPSLRQSFSGADAVSDRVRRFRRSPPRDQHIACKLVHHPPERLTSTRGRHSCQSVLLEPLPTGQYVFVARGPRVGTMSLLVIVAVGCSSSALHSSGRRPTTTTTNVVSVADIRAAMLQAGTARISWHCEDRRRASKRQASALWHCTFRLAG